MQETLMDQAVSLMLYGMGTVFVFLAILVLATTAMSAITGRFFKSGAGAAGNAGNAIPVPTAAPANQDELIAVIGTAVHQYREQKKSSK